MKARVICHSKLPNGEEFVTFELTVPAPIIPQINRHGSSAQSVASRRAIPTKTLIESVRANPPTLRMLRNKRGMVPDRQFKFSDDTVNEAQEEYSNLLEHTLQFAEKWAELGVAKQEVNDVLTPYIEVPMIWTFHIRWYEYMRNLRTHESARDTFAELVGLMDQALSGSYCIERLHHMPLITPGVIHKTPFDYICESAKRCARASTNRLEAQTDRDHILGRTDLWDHGHHSPFDHQIIFWEDPPQPWTFGMVRNRHWVDMGSRSSLTGRQVMTYVNQT